MAEFGGQLIWLAFLVERDGLADVVHDHLAGIAPSQVFLELFADGRVHRALHVLVQRRKQFPALHITLFWSN